MPCSHEWRWVELRNISIEQDGRWRHFGFFVCRLCPGAKWQEVEWRDGQYHMIEEK
jgi:hypothetical protein